MFCIMFENMWAYIAQKRPKFVPADSGERLTVPDLSLSIGEILERWHRNLPLDIIQRNGTFAVDDDSEITDDVFDMDDPDQMDIIEFNERLSNNVKNAQTSSLQPNEQSEQTQAVEPAETASVSEPANEA